MNLEKEKYKELFQQYPRKFVEFLYCAEGMKAAQAQPQRKYAARKKGTETPTMLLNVKEENVQRHKRYQAKMREKQQAESVCDVEKRREKYLERLHNVQQERGRWKHLLNTQLKIYHCPKVMLNDRRQLYKGSKNIKMTVQTDKVLKPERI